MPKRITPHKLPEIVDEIDHNRCVRSLRYYRREAGIALENARTMGKGAIGNIDRARLFLDRPDDADVHPEHNVDNVLEFLNISANFPTCERKLKHTLKYFERIDRLRALIDEWDTMIQSEGAAEGGGAE